MLHGLIPHGNSCPAGTGSQAPLAGLLLWPDGQLQAYPVWEAHNSGVTATGELDAHQRELVWQARDKAAKGTATRR